MCSWVIDPVLKQACPSEKILSHLFMNRAINISLNASFYHAVDRMGDMRIRFKCATDLDCVRDVQCTLRIVP